MSEYELSPGAERDLREIARYTIREWSERQSVIYETTLRKHFSEITSGSMRTRTPIPYRPELLSSRCEHHYVFSLHRERKPTLILAVFHEKMDLMARLAERLQEDGI